MKPESIKTILSPGEYRHFRLMLEGLCDKEIAAKLNVSIHAVKSALCKAYIKLGISGRSRLLGYEVTIRKRSFRK